MPLTAVSGLHPPNSPSLKPEVLPHTSSVPLVANPVSLEKLQEKENCCGKRGKNVVCPPPPFWEDKGLQHPRNKALTGGRCHPRSRRY